MTDDSLFEQGCSYYSDHGVIRTIGAVADFCGSEIQTRCWWLHKVLKWDRGKGYPLTVRFRAARHGLSAHSYLWLGLDEADVEPYLRSDERIRELNCGYIEPIHNKNTFQLLTEPYIDALPTLYGRVDDGVFVEAQDAQPHEDMVDVLSASGAAVLKPTDGSQGEGVYVLKRRDDGFRINGQPANRSGISNLVAGLDEYVVTEFIQQHQYAASIYPDATNTLRIFSVIDPDTGEPGVLRATHRFGTADSAPTDNWSRGGYCAPVDVSTGTLERLIVLDEPPRSRPVSHPETGAQIEGVTVPHWEAVCSLVCDLADLHHDAPIVGWDVVVADDGPIVLEGNARPGKELLQPERGIFEDRRARRLLGRVR